MSRNSNATRIRRSTAVPFALALALLTGGAASAAPNCRVVRGTVSLGPSTQECHSAIALCAAGSLRGTLRGNSEFSGTSIVPTVDTAATGVVLLTGDNVIHTDRGDLFTRDAIVLATTGNGEFAEVDVVVGGTGDYAGATGRFVATGTFVNGAGEGSLDGEICLP